MQIEYFMLISACHSLQSSLEYWGLCTEWIYCDWMLFIYNTILKVIVWILIEIKTKCIEENIFVFKILENHELKLYILCLMFKFCCGRISLLWHSQNKTAARLSASTYTDLSLYR
jgi:hypothetical protein